MPRHESNPILLAQVITAGLILGAVLFTAVGVVMNAASGPAAGRPGDDFMLLALGGVWVSTAAALVVVSRVRTATIRREWRLHEAELRSDPDAAGRFIASRWTMSVILRGALLEGPALFGAMLCYQYGQWPGLVVAGVNAAVLAVMFPTRAGLEAFAARVAGPSGGYQEGGK